MADPYQNLDRRGPVKTAGQGQQFGARDSQSFLGETRASFAQEAF